jgi:1-acyl-sn-glycerol-3-phosphate acyltransferase
MRVKAFWAAAKRARQLPAAYRVIVLLLWPLLRVLFRRDWRGAENIPADGCVVAPNHLSYVDPFAIALYLYDNDRPPYYLGKEAVFRIPVFGRLIAWADQIPVYRGTGQAADAMRAAVAAVQEGKTVVVYPEGTLTRDPGGWPMRGKTGAARIALTTRCPVIPVAMWGPQEVLGTYQKDVHFFPRKTMHVLAGPPGDLADFYDRPLDSALLAEATDRIMDAITAQLEVLRGEQAPAVRFDSRTMGVPETGNPNKERP